MTLHTLSTLDAGNLSTSWTFLRLFRDPNLLRRNGLLSALVLNLSSLDRALGCGLKREDAFHNTHLGRIGR